jgi:hypothetical protein
MMFYASNERLLMPGLHMRQIGVVFLYRPWRPSLLKGITMAKSIKLDVLKLKANTVFRDSLNSYSVQRLAIQCFVENVLMTNNAYNGFGYLTESEVPAGQTFGLAYDDTAKKNIFPDPTRIKFF